MSNLPDNSKNLDSEATRIVHSNDETTRVFLKDAFWKLKVCPPVGRSFQCTITNERQIVGRERTANIILQDAYVSATHVECSADEQGIRILDLASHNGVVGLEPNGILKPGRSVVIGRSRLICLPNSRSESSGYLYLKLLIFITLTVFGGAWAAQSNFDFDIDVVRQRFLGAEKIPLVTDQDNVDQQNNRIPQKLQKPIRKPAVESSIAAVDRTNKPVAQKNKPQHEPQVLTRRIESKPRAQKPKVKAVASAKTEAIPTEPQIKAKNTTANKMNVTSDEILVELEASAFSQVATLLPKCVDCSAEFSDSVKDLLNPAGTIPKLLMQMREINTLVQNQPQYNLSALIFRNAQTLNELMQPLIKQHRHKDIKRILDMMAKNGLALDAQSSVRAELNRYGNTFYEKAYAVERINPEQAKRIYQDGLAQLPNDIAAAEKISKRLAMLP